MLVYCSILNCKCKVIQTSGQVPTSEISPGQRSADGVDLQATEYSALCRGWLVSRDFTLSRAKLGMETPKPILVSGIED